MDKSELDIIRSEAFDASPTATVIIDAETNICLDLNFEAIKLLQFSSKEEAIGRSPIEISAPYQYDGTPSAEKAAYYMNLALNGEKVHFEWRFQRQNGEQWDSAIDLERFTFNNRHLIRFTCIDITDKKTKTKLQALVQSLLFDLNSCTSLKAGLDRILETVFQIDKIDCGGFYISDQSSDALVPATCIGLSEEFVADCKFGRPGSTVYDLAANGQSVFCNYQDICRDNDLHLQKEGIRSYAVIPVIAQGKMIALMCLFSHTTDSIPQNLHYAFNTFALIVSGIILRLFSDAALLKEKKLVDNLLDNLPILFFLYDSSLHLTRWNRKYIELLGYSDEELRGMPIDAWSRSEEGKIFARKSLEHLKEHGSFSNIEVNLYTKDNRPIPFLLNGTLLDTDNGLVILGTGIDITDRKAAIEALEKSEERFRAIFNSTYQFTFLLTKEGKVIEVNRPALEAFSLNTWDVSGKNLWDTDFFSNNPELIQKIHEAAVQSAEGRFIRFEIELVNTRKETMIFDFSINPVSDQNGNVQMLVAEGRNITEIKKTEAMLNKAQKLDSLGVLAGGIAHDFNNLLAGIYGYIDMVRESLKGDPAGKYFDSMLSTMDRAKALSMQLLTFAKGNASVKKLSELSSFIKETAQFALSGSNISCKFTIANDLSTGMIDKNQIEQVIDNIVINAKQAMPEGGTIEIGAKNVSFRKGEHTLLNEGRYIKISIKDSGSGIPQDILPFIFDPFFTTKPKGNGLGLATCYSIINQHGGIIEVDSAPGKGSTFHIFLPASGESAPEKTEKEAMHKGSGTFIIMDDEDVVRFIIQSMLSKMGYTVLCTKDGQEAIDCYTNELKNGRIVSGMLFDLTVPGRMGGMEAASIIRKTDKNIPIFVASGYADDSLLSNPMDCGFNAAISKPFRMSELSHILNMHLNK